MNSYRVTVFLAVFLFSQAASAQFLMPGERAKKVPIFTENASGGVSRPISSVLQEKWPSIEDFGAVCNGSIDDGTPLSKGLTAFKGLYIGTGLTCKTSTVASSLAGRWFGLGKVTDGSGNTRPGFFTQIASAPATTCDTSGGIDTAFNCDTSNVQFPLEHRVIGAATLGQPTTGYRYVPNAYPNYSYVYSSSGWNNSTSDTTGRTAMVDYMSNVFQAGQGDMVAYNAQCSMANQTRAGATNWLANPACVLFNGQVTAGAAGQGLTPSQFNMVDNGFDVTGVGMDINSNRTVNTGALGAYWGAYLSQSIGSKAIDYGFGAIGNHVVGIDMSAITLQASKAAIALPQDARIYGSASSSNSLYATSLGTNYFMYDSGISAWEFIVASSSIFQIYGTQIVATKPLFVTGGITSTSASAFLPQLIMNNQANDNHAGYFVVTKQRVGAANNGAVQIGDTLGTFIFQGGDTTGNLQNTGQLFATVKAVGASSVTSDLNIATGGGALFVTQGPISILTSSTTGTALNTSGTVFMASLSTSSSAQTAYACIKSTNEIISVAVANNCATSSERYKEDIKPSTLGLETVMALKPIVYHYKLTGNDNFDNAPSQRSLQIGFSAEQAAKVNPLLIGVDDEGRPNTFRYEQYVAVLTSAIQELKAANDSLKTEVELLKRKTQ